MTIPAVTAVTLPGTTVAAEDSADFRRVVASWKRSSFGDNLDAAPTSLLALACRGRRSGRGFCTHSTRCAAPRLGGHN